MSHECLTCYIAEMNNLLVWIHVLAAMTWIGGMVFLSQVLVPELRRAGLVGERLLLFRGVARRFRVVVWLAMPLLIGTGVILPDQRGLALTEPFSWPRPFQIKLTLVACLIGLALYSSRRAPHYSSRRGPRNATPRFRDEPS